MDLAEVGPVVEVQVVVAKTQKPTHAVSVSRPLAERLPQTRTKLLKQQTLKPLVLSGLPLGSM